MTTLMDTINDDINGRHKWHPLMDTINDDIKLQYHKCCIVQYIISMHSFAQY
jgi:hypothetical protein